MLFNWVNAAIQRAYAAAVDPNRNSSSRVLIHSFNLVHLEGDASAPMSSKKGSNSALPEHGMK